MYTRQGIRAPWARPVAQPWDNSSHTTYLVGEAMYLAPRISRTDRGNELRLVP
jgi:hypothetical protein